MFNDLALILTVWGIALSLCWLWGEEQHSSINTCPLCFGMCVLGFVDVYGVLKCVNPFCVCVLILCSDML